MPRYGRWTVEKANGGVHREEKNQLEPMLGTKAIKHALQVASWLLFHLPIQRSPSTRAHSTGLTNHAKSPSQQQSKPWLQETGRVAPPPPKLIPHAFNFPYRHRDDPQFNSSTILPLAIRDGLGLCRPDHRPCTQNLKPMTGT